MMLNCYNLGNKRIFGFVCIGGRLCNYKGFRIEFQVLELNFMFLWNVY